MRAQKILKKAEKGGKIVDLSGADPVTRLLLVCNEANHLDIDLEEALYARLENIISEIKNEDKT